MLEAGDITATPLVTDVLQRLAACDVFNIDSMATQLQEHASMWAACSCMPAILKDMGHDPVERHLQLRLIRAVCTGARLFCDPQLDIARGIGAVTVPAITATQVAELKKVCTDFVEVVRYINTTTADYSVFLTARSVKAPAVRLDASADAAAPAGDALGVTLMPRMLELARITKALQWIDQFVNHAANIAHAVDTCAQTVSKSIVDLDTIANGGDSQVQLRQQFEALRSDTRWTFDTLGPVKDYVAAIAKCLPLFGQVVTAMNQELTDSVNSLTTKVTGLTEVMIGTILTRAALIGVCGTNTEAVTLYRSLMTSGKLTMVPLGLRNLLTTVATTTDADPSAEAPSAPAAHTESESAVVVPASQQL